MVFKSADPTLKEAGSEPEMAVFNALLRLGKRPGVDFSFQSKQFGGRIDKGGRVLDFEIYEPRLGINVQGVYFHYEKGSAIIQSDIQTRAFLAAMGITLIFIDEDDALKAVPYTPLTLPTLTSSQISGGGG
mgnify:CR=1 FL=1